MRVTSFLCIGRDRAELTDGFNCRASSSTHLQEVFEEVGINRNNNKINNNNDNDNECRANP